jgi:hypothetical protein
MAVKEADGDSRSFFREGYEDQAKLPQVPFEAMPEWRLQEVIDHADEWADDKVPPWFDVFNSCGGARATAMANAKYAREELKRR